MDKEQNKKELLNKLDAYFNSEITTKEFSQVTRSFIHTAILMYLEDDVPEVHRQQISEGYYHLTNFLELLDPCLL